MDFIVEMLRMFSKLKEIMKCTVNKTWKDIKAKMRKIPIEMSKQKNLVGRMKISLEDLISRVIAPEDKISQLVDEVLQTSRKATEYEKEIKCMNK